MSFKKDFCNREVLLASIVGFLGGPISSLVSAATFAFLRKNNASNPWVAWFLLGIVGMPISHVAAMTLFKWDVNSLAFLQSFGRYQNYSEWRRQEKEQRIKKEALEKKKKESAEIAAIKRHPSYSSYRLLMREGACQEFTDYRHLKIWSVTYIRERDNFLTHQDLSISNKEKKELWRRNPRSAKICLRPNMDGIDGKKAKSEKQLVWITNRGFRTDWGPKDYANFTAYEKKEGEWNAIHGVRLYCDPGEEHKGKTPLATGLEDVNSYHIRKWCDNGYIKQIFKNPIIVKNYS